MLGGCKGHGDLCRFRKTEFVSKPFHVNFLGTICIDSGVDLEWETVVPNREMFCRSRAKASASCVTCLAISHPGVPPTCALLSPTPPHHQHHCSHFLSGLFRISKILFISLKDHLTQELLLSLCCSHFSYRQLEIRRVEGPAQDHLDKRQSFDWARVS